MRTLLTVPELLVRLIWTTGGRGKEESKVDSPFSRLSQYHGLCGATCLRGRT